MESRKTRRRATDNAAAQTMTDGRLRYSFVVVDFRLFNSKNTMEKNVQRWKKQTHFSWRNRDALAHLFAPP